jgi:phosphonate transport system substrate-binding protein
VRAADGIRRRWIGLLALLAAGLGLVPAALAQEAGPAEEQEPLRLGVVGFYNPRLMYLKYQPLADYLTEQTPYRWELDISATYEQTVDDLCAGRLALAYLGPLTYVIARHRCHALPLVRLNTGGRDTYRSVILVREDSEIDELSDLEGRSIGFGAALSTSSHLVPRAMLRDAGVGSEQGIRFRYFKHHERAARAVLLKEVAACGVRDTVADKFLERGLRAIERSVPIPNFPLVVPAGSSHKLRREIMIALIDRPKEDRDLAERIRGWDDELAGGFARVRDSDFDPIRRIAARIFGADFETAPVSELQSEGIGD